MGSRIFLVLAIAAGIAHSKTLLFLPVVGDLDKSSDVATVNDLYKDALVAGYHGDVKSIARDSAKDCADKTCAARLAVQAGADEAIYATVKRLGTKWIFSSTLVDAKGEGAFIQRGTAQSLEDLEAVTRRVSDAILARKSVDDVASLDNITGKEENSEPTRRRSLLNSGFTLGYLVPLGGTYAYLKENPNSGALCALPCTEQRFSTRQRYSQMVRISWLNSWEFRENLMLGVDGSWALPNVVGADINLQYLFTRSDFSPFVGGGAGIQLVVPLDDSLDNSKRNSGPALNAQAGMIFFRTYDIHVVAKTQYQIVFNSDMDRGITYDLGVVYRPSSHGGGFWSSFWKIALIGLVVSSVAGAAAP